jgi:hypothetical protein
LARRARYEAVGGRKHRCEATYHRACLLPARRPGCTRAEEAEWRCDRCDAKHAACRAKEDADEEEDASQAELERESQGLSQGLTPGDAADAEAAADAAADAAKKKLAPPKLVFGRRDNYRAAKAREDARLEMVGGRGKPPKAKPKAAATQVRSTHGRSYFEVSGGRGVYNTRS